MIEQFSSYYHAMLSNVNARSTGEDIGISYEELNAIIVPHRVRYPNLRWEHDISKEDLERIFNDFPEITSVDEIREKSEIISAFYETFAKRDIVPEVAAYQRRKKTQGEKTTGADVTYTSTPEMEYLLLHPDSCAMHPINDILAWHGSINSKPEIEAVWNRLYNDLSSSNQHLVHINN